MYLFEILYDHTSHAQILEIPDITSKPIVIIL